MAGRHVLLALMLLALGGWPAAAEGPVVTGHVSDDSGRRLPGVSVALHGAGGAAVVETVTDEKGWYRLDAAPGRYELRFSLVNFGGVTKEVAVADAAAVLVSAVLPLAFTADIVVTGHRTFRNLAEATNPGESLIGLAGAASEGAVTAKQLQHRPLTRPGEVLEAVPGVVITQHSGEGKANQYYLRGFNLDHGTDFAVSVAGVPVNMPTHGHGQGWADVNFLIPELVSGIQFKKGPYFAEEGDFSTAGAANISYVNALEHPISQLTVGGNGFRRTLFGMSPRAGGGHLLVALETMRSDGSWDAAQRYRKLNGIVRYSRGDSRQGSSITAAAHVGRWLGSDQVPRRALEAGLISRFGTLDPTTGGETSRYALSAETQRSSTFTATKIVGYVVQSNLDLFSNFTYFLSDPVNGDQFEQVDDRLVFGGRVSHRRQARWLGLPVEHGLGLQARHDRIGGVGLYATRRRERLATVREDRVGQSSLGLYYQSEWDLAPRLRGTAGLRGDVYRFRVRSAAAANGGAEIAGMLSPKLGIAYAPARKLELYGNFGYGYHSNDARGVVLSVEPLSGEPADRATPLVRARGAEGGVRTVLVPRLQTTVSVWTLSADSELLFAGDAGTTEPGRPSRRTGVEWANYLSVRPWLTLDADVAWSSARFTDANPLGSSIPGAVERVASVGVSLGEVRRWTGGLRLRHVGPRPLVEDGSAASAGSLLMNAEAGYRIARRTRLLVDLLNLTDTRASDVDYYYGSRLPGEAADGVDDVHTHPMAPRTVRLSVQIDF